MIMPFKSQAQRRLFYVMMERGEISPEVVKRWEQHTKNKDKLPERVSYKREAIKRALERHKGGG